MCELETGSWERFLNWGRQTLKKVNISEIVGGKLIKKNNVSEIAGRQTFQNISKPSHKAN